MEKKHHVSAFILAGGKSSRFKQDKALFLYKGKPLISHVIDAVLPLIETVSIVANDIEKFRHLQIPCYPDLIEGMGSLGGLYTALKNCRTEIALIIGCDMPHISIDLISYMISLVNDYDLVVPCVNGWYEPLYALYSVRCLPIITEYSLSGKQQIIAFFEKVHSRKIDEDEIRQFADPEFIFRNINYQDDIE